MKKTKIKTTSGSITGLSENTATQDFEATTWSTRSVIAKVSSSSRSKRIASINERIRGGSSRNVNTAG